MTAFFVQSSNFSLRFRPRSVAETFAGTQKPSFFFAGGEQTPRFALGLRQTEVWTLNF
jgi:hypothetical protein